MEDLREHPYFDEILEAFESRVIPEPNSGCFLWCAGVFTSGYGRITMRSHGIIAERSHRMAWRLYKSPIPKGIHVLHRCDVPCCVNIDHLFLGTHADNMADMVKKGRQAKGQTHARTKGEDHGPAKLTEQEALSILHDPRLQREIAAEFNVSAPTVSDIQRGRSWPHLGGGKRRYKTAACRC